MDIRSAGLSTKLNQSDPAGLALAMQVTVGERLRAAAQIGGDVTALTVAFGSRVPEPVKQPTTAAAADSHGRSVLELELDEVGLLGQRVMQHATSKTLLG